MKREFQLFHAAFEQDPVHVMTLTIARDELPVPSILETIYRLTQNLDCSWAPRAAQMGATDIAKIVVIGSGDRRSTSVSDYIILNQEGLPPAKYVCEACGWRLVPDSEGNIDVRLLGR